MDPIRNPYAPGAGRRPAALVGRDRVLGDWQVAMQRAERGRSTSPLVLYGLRGVGKTVLLTRMRQDAEARDWLAVQVEAGQAPSLREMLGEALYAPLAEAVRPSAGRRVLRALKTALSFRASYDSAGTWSFGVDLADVPGGGADSGVLEADVSKVVKDVALAAREDGVGLAILVDEAQDLPAEELGALALVGQLVAREGWPVLLVLAGLPSLPARLAEAKSYAERFAYEQVESLSAQEAAQALEVPAREEGVSWEPEAASHVVEQSGAYPYFLQQFGQETWAVAEGEVVSVQAAREGVRAGWGSLDEGFFRARWERATAAERDYLRAMAECGAEVPSSAVAERLGRAASSLSQVRRHLVDKGLIYAPGHGLVAFTVPGMGDFIVRQAVAE